MIIIYLILSYGAQVLKVMASKVSLRFAIANKNMFTMLGHVGVTSGCGASAAFETLAVNKLLDSHASGDIYRCMHPLRTSVASYKW